MHIIERLKIASSPYQISIFRIVVGLHILYACSSKIFDLLLAVQSQQNVTVLLPHSLQSYLFENCIPFIRVLTMVLAAFLVIGLFTRYILPVLTISFLLLFSFYYQGVNAPIHWLYLWFPLIVLCFSKCSDVLSVDSLIKKKTVTVSVAYTWPLELVSVWFVYIYFFAGIAKLLPLQKFVVWINGETSRHIIYNRYLDSPFHYIFGAPFFDYSKPSIFFSILSIGAVVIELSTLLLLFTKRYTVLVLMLVVMMHLFLYMCGVAGFLQTALVLGVALLPNRYFKFKTG